MGTKCLIVIAFAKRLTACYQSNSNRNKDNAWKWQHLKPKPIFYQMWVPSDGMVKNWYWSIRFGFVHQTTPTITISLIRYWNGGIVHTHRIRMYAKFRFYDPVWTMCVGLFFVVLLEIFTSSPPLKLKILCIWIDKWQSRRRRRRVTTRTNNTFWISSRSFQHIFYC